MTTCKMENCGKPLHCKGFCKSHYQQQWSTGSPEIKRPNPHGTPEERFWRKVVNAGPDECWTWVGQKDKDKYGMLRVGSTIMRAHRFSYILHRGEIPDGLLALHTCNNTLCVNPNHLYLGTHDDNMEDRKESGHYATGENHPMAKLSNEQAEQVRMATGTYEEIGGRFGISKYQVGNIKRGDQRGS